MEQSEIFTREVCPVCSHPESRIVFKCKDHTVSGEYFNLVECSVCGFRYTNPVPHPAVIGRYYKSEDYISHSGTRKGIIARLYHTVRVVTLKRKVKLISGLVKRGTVLDFGCGTGNFLAVCKEAGWNTFGIEPDSGARTVTAEQIPVYGSWQQLQDKENDLAFDVITMWHVLEHVYDLDDTLRFLKSRLNRSGRLIIAVPNFRSVDAQHYGSFWAAYDVPRHLYHFDRESLSRLAKNAAFEVEKVLPMKFDSYYVSMLSEKYRDAGVFGLVKAVIRGFVSNFSARRSGEYSSLIYILRHK